jgi:hypothetical protein
VDRKRCWRSTRVLAPAVAAAILAGAGIVGAQRPDAFSASREHAAIRYASGPVDTRISRLNRELEAGAVRLSFDRTNGYLTSLLAALDLPAESQMLVFSETSAQAPLITPSSPRALFFNDATALGWVRGGAVLEVATHDPRQGTIFYTLEQKPVDTPQFKREIGCLQCHLSWDTLAVPGFLTISTFPMSDDKNAYATGVVVDHRTPLDQRWGGWYVTGTAVPARHFGNLPVIRPARELLRPAPPTPRLQTVDRVFDASGFPAPTSDVAALMVFGHQTHMINLLTRLGWEARVAAHPATAGETPRTDRVRQAALDVVDYLLFVDEAPIDRKIEGSSGFAEKFSAQGPKDRTGRSLRQLDLEHRLMRYPCSYMIYTGAFDALPPSAKDLVYQRLWQVLSGAETGKPYARLALADRRAIVEILRDTKKDLPAYFQPVVR